MLFIDFRNNFLLGLNLKKNYVKLYLSKIANKKAIGTINESYLKNCDMHAYTISACKDTVSFGVTNKNLNQNNYI